MSYSVLGDTKYIKLEVGMTIGHWTILDIFAGKKRKKMYCKCRCICGKESIKDGYALRTGRTKSCGCIGWFNAKNNLKHGKTKSDEYKSYLHMIDRCYNSNNKDYHNYGGRGIVVCDRWLMGFIYFIEDMGNRPSKDYTLDRINNNDNYSPTNCRWATRKTQMQNVRYNINITIDGVTKCIAEWARIVGINSSVISRRLKRGWNPIDAVLTPTYSKRQ